MRHVRRWGAVYLLVLLFLGSWLGHFLMMLQQVRDEARSHGETFAWAQLWPEFWSSTFENWQSEWLQLVFQAILLLGAKHWLFQVDAEDMERLENKVDAIALRLGLDPDEADEPRPQREEDRERPATTSPRSTAESG